MPQRRRPARLQRCRLRRHPPRRLRYRRRRRLSKKPDVIRRPVNKSSFSILYQNRNDSLPAPVRARKRYYSVFRRYARYGRQYCHGTPRSIRYQKMKAERRSSVKRHAQSTFRVEMRFNARRRFFCAGECLPVSFQPADTPRRNRQRVAAWRDEVEATG